MLLHSTISTVAILGMVVAAPGMAMAQPDNRPAHALATPVTVSVTSTVLESVYAVSRTGRYVLGTPDYYGGRIELWDLKKDKRLKRLPRAARSQSLSDNGRYVAYLKPIGSWGRGKVLVYDRKTGRTKNVTTKSNGSTLRPSWRNRCTNATCSDEDQQLVDSPQLAGGQISGNAKWVAFCANFGKPARIDLFIKNLRNSKLKKIKGACQPEIEDGDVEKVQAPSVSATARTVLLQGRFESSEGDLTWAAGRALFNRSRLVEIGGLGNSMTRDGRTVSIFGDFSGTGYPTGVQWYDVATGVRVPADPPGMHLTMGNSSRDGQYVLWRTTSTGQMQIRDRGAGVDYDLESALVAAGFTPDSRAGSPGDLWGHTNTASAMSGNGRVVFVKAADEKILAVRWAA